MVGIKTLEVHCSAADPPFCANVTCTHPPSVGFAGFNGQTRPLVPKPKWSSLLCLQQVPSTYIFHCLHCPPFADATPKRTEGATWNSTHRMGFTLLPTFMRSIIPIFALMCTILRAYGFEYCCPPFLQQGFRPLHKTPPPAHTKTGIVYDPWEAW